MRGFVSASLLVQDTALAERVKATVDAPVPGHVFFDGGSLRVVFQAYGLYSKVRPCDGAGIAGWITLPGKPVQEVFDGTSVWMVYGSSTLSIR